MPDLSRIWFYALAIREMGSPVTFSLHLLPKTKEAMARSSLSPRDFVAKRFRDHLQGVPFFFVLELTKSGDIHLHGAVSAAGLEPHDLDTRLRKVAGDRRKLLGREERYFHDHIALDRKGANPSTNFDGRNGLFGWASYCAKDIARNQRRIGSSPIGRSLDVSQWARRIHSEIITTSPMTDQPPEAKSEDANVPLRAMQAICRPRIASTL